MTTDTETATKTKQAPDFYIFENTGTAEKGGKPAGAAFLHKKGKGFTVLINGKRYAAFPPKAKAAEAQATQGESASRRRIEYCDYIAIISNRR
ncbi:MAG: hypothetical protein IPM24_03415 [Bryobacterales bacterium]|nr:hypothetical protein [Bryobacterales bacterium]